MKHTSDGGSTEYYDLPKDAKDLQDLVEYRNMNFAIGNIFKACFRMGKKSGQDDLYDLNKIIFFAQREIERIKKLDKGEILVQSTPSDDAINGFKIEDWNNYSVYDNLRSWKEFPDHINFTTKVKIIYNNGTTAIGRVKDFSWNEQKNSGYNIVQYKLI